MGGIRKVSHTHQRQDFRSRLQRALSLSSSESGETSSPSASEEGDTTEDEVLQDGNDCSDDQENSNSADESEEALRERRKKCRYERDMQKSEQTQLPGDGNAVALECVAELNDRMKSIESSSYVQSTCNETVRNDLADIFARLAIVETEMKKVAKRGNNKATEDQSIRRSLRRGNSD
ncbi:hypothetical protein CBS147308_10294 [Penicillium roqueforti]|nr:hypothetical protein CBS147308_10294 [Penicillium roqueforti]